MLNTRRRMQKWLGIPTALAIIFFMALSLYLPRNAEAIPAFARQTGMACSTCHYQTFPALNEFGRAFKAGGYTMIGGESLVEGDMLSFPSVFNVSLVTKIRYQKSNGTGQSGTTGQINQGQLQFPDEAALIVGGRAGDHVGFILDMSLKEGDSRFTSYKVPVVFDAKDTRETKLSVIPFTTDVSGASYGFELLNTGAYGRQRPVEHAKDFSAQQYIDADTKATGFTFAAANSQMFANYTMWAPVHGTNDAGPFLNYLRAAFTPRFGGFDLGAGAQYWSGTTKFGPPDNPTRQSGNAWALDAQAQGTVANYPLGVYASYASAKKSKADMSNIFNTSAYKDKSAFALSADLGVIPNRLSLLAAYRLGKTGDPAGTGYDTDNATTLGIAYNPMQNLQLQFNQSWYSGNGRAATGEGNQLTTLVLYAAF